VPFLIRYPLAERRVEQHVVSAADLAPTIADIAGVQLPWTTDGSSLATLIRDGDASGLPDDVYEEWVGDRQIPQWWEIRTQDFAFIELVTGEREFYDLRVDPLQLSNVADDPAYAAEIARLESELELQRSS